MDQQEARDILKGCGGCILGLIVLLVGAILFFAIAYGVLWGGAFALVAVLYYGPIVLAVVVPLLIVCYMIYVILCSLGITGK